MRPWPSIADSFLVIANLILATQVHKTPRFSFVRNALLITYVNGEDFEISLN